MQRVIERALIAIGLFCAISILGLLVVTQSSGEGAPAGGIAIDGADLTWKAELERPAGLVKVDAPLRIIVEGAATGKGVALALPPELVLYQAAPRIIVEGAAAGKGVALALPPELVLYQAAPRIIVEGAATGKGLHHLVSLDEAMAQFSRQRIEEARETIAAGIARGVDMESAEALLAQAEDAWQTADYVRARSLAERAKTAAEQIKREAESAAHRINQARGAIAAGIATGVDMGSAEALLAQAEKAWKAADYTRASTLAGQAKTAAGQTISALQQIEEAREAIAAGIAAGVDMRAAEAFLSQAGEAWQAADYGRARSVAEQAKTTAEQIKREAESAAHRINQARETIAAGIARGVDMGSAEALLAQAEDAWEAADYARARSVAEQAKTAAGQIKREAESAAHRINQAREAIATGKLGGFNVHPAQSLLLQAEQAWRNGDHASALEIAGKAISLAIDVDQDGIPNYRDFAPTINNNHIYSGTIGAFVLLVGLSISISSYRRKKRAERKEIERRKRAILEMIDEV